MDPEAAGFRPRLLGQRDLREHLLLPAPHAAQALEHRAVTEPGIREDLVQALHRDGFRLTRRPLGERNTRRDRRGRGEVAGGVPGPDAVVIARGRGVDGDRTASVRLSRGDHDLDRDRPVLGEHERGLEGEVVQDAATEAVTGVQGQLHERGSGQQHRPEHSVIGQPGVRVQREPAGEDESVAVREQHLGSQQGVPSGTEAESGRITGCGSRTEPELFVLEGVGGEVDASGVGAGVVGRPVDGGAVGVEFGEGGDDGVGLGPVLPQGRHERGLGHAFLGHGGQNPARAQLQVGAHALGVQMADAIREPDCLADVVHPVVGGQQLLTRRLTAQVGDDRNAGRVEGGRLEEGAELVEHGFHARRVEGVADPQPLRLLEPVSDRQYFVLVAGDDDRGGPVQGGDGDVVREQGQDLVLGRLDGDHCPAFGQGLHQPAACGDQSGSVLEGPDAGDVRGGQLTDGVAEEVVGGDAPVLDQPEEGHLDREQTSLRVDGPVQQVRLRVEDQVLHRPVQVPVQLRAHRVERLGEHRERLVQLPAHPRPLRALAGEQERRTPTHGRAPDHTGRGAAGDQDLQPPDEVLPARRHHGGPVLEVRAGGDQGPAVVAGRRLLVLTHPRQQTPRLTGQRLRRLRRQHPRHHRKLDRRLHLRHRLLTGSGLENHVRVRPAHTERRHTRTTRPVTRLRPLPRLRQQLDCSGGPVDLRRGLCGVEGGRQDAMTHGHDHLDDSGDARGGLGVAQVRLQRAEPQRPAVLRALLTVGRQQRLRLDRVAEGGAGAVGLDGVDVGAGQTRVGEGGADDALLGGAVGGGEAVARAVLVDGGAPDDREDLVAVAAGVREPLHEEHADALGPARAVSVVGERLAAAVGGQATLTLEVQEGGGRGHDGHTTGEGHVALAGAQRLRGQVQGDQGRRARRVHRHRRTFQAQGVGDATGDDTAGVPDAEERFHALRNGVRGHRVVVVHEAGEDAGAAAAQGGGRDARLLHGFP